LAEVWLETALGRAFAGDSVEGLRALASESVDLVVADPPYGIKKAEWDTWSSRQAYVAWAQTWLVEVARVLTPRGSAYVMGFSEVLADLKWACADLFVGCRWLVWSYRNKGNMGSDWGRSHESLLHLRKSQDFTMNTDAVRIPYNGHTTRYPKRRQGASSQFGGSGASGKDWQPHPMGAKPRDVLEIPVLNNGMSEKSTHPTQKPLELIRRLVAASSQKGDLVLDPFAGSGTTAVVCELLGRRWMTWEREEDYLKILKVRLAEVAGGSLSLASMDHAQRAMSSNRAKVRA
jgi:site-specific DNA-methyltransferase (adenine-specific)